MDKVLSHIKARAMPESATKVSTILNELREMNANNVSFYEALLLEINELKTLGQTNASQLSRLEESLESHKTATDEKLAEFEARLNTVDSDNVTLKKDNGILKEKVLELECRSRKRNLIIGNLAEKPGVNSRESYDEVHAKVVNLFSEKLGILGADKMLFRNIHRLGTRSALHTRPRNVIVAFLLQPDVDKVLQACRDMKDPSISIRTDLPGEYNEIRNALLKIRGQYRDLPTPVKCKLAYKKFRPVLYKSIPGGDDVEVQIVKGPDGKYHELLEDAEM